MHIRKTFYIICEQKRITFDFLAWIATRFVPEEKRYEVYRKVAYAPYRYLSRKRVKSLYDDGKKPEAPNVGGVVVLTEKTYVKEHVSFNGMIIQGSGKVKIGKYFHSGEDCRIITTNHNYEGDFIPYDTKEVNKDVEIGDFVWLGTRVMILPGTKIGEGSIIQGGSVVHGEIPPYSIAGGNPCKVFKTRNIEHFLKLKEEGKFL